MDDKWANIDLIFRNGLKDYEVLPPQDVWDNISPVIKRKNNYFSLLRSAAAVAVLATMGFLAYRWAMEATDAILPELLTLNQEPPSTVIKTIPSVISEQENQIITDIAASPFEAENEALSVSAPDNATRAVSEKVSPFVPNYLLSDYQSTQGLQIPVNRVNTNINSPEFEAVKYEFIQENLDMPVIERWSVSAMATPTHYSQFTSSGNDLAKQLMESDQNRVSYTGGVGLAYKISSRFSIQTGLYYSSLGQEMSGISTYSGFRQYDNSKGGPNFGVLTVNGTVQTNNSDIFLSSSSLPERIITNYTIDVFDPVKSNLNYVSSSLYQNMSFLELPVIVRYKVIDRKIDINLIGGMSYNFLLNNSVYALLDDGKYPVGTTEGLNTVSLSSSLGMGMEYKLTQNLSLNLEPTFRYYLNPFNSAKSTGLHPYSLGIFSGVAYKF